MSDLDYDAIREKWLQQCGACDGGLPMACVCPTDDPRPVILDLAQRAEADRAAVERVRELADEWDSRVEFYRGTGNYRAMASARDELRRALDPKEDQ